jgi:hypothetical protein|eukprot:COSAG02_NODE_1427_length_12664_cov_3.151850_2_plen_80_part_00
MCFKLFPHTEPMLRACSLANARARTMRVLLVSLLAWELDKRFDYKVARILNLLSARRLNLTQSFARTFYIINANPSRSR